MIIKFYKADKVEQECKPLFSFFPDGQPHVKVEPLTWKGFDKVEIHCSIRNPLEQFQWMMVWDVVSAHYNPVTTNIYWLYGARMDRAIDDNQPSTFDVVIDAIPNYRMKVGKINILDLHNPACFHIANAIPLNPIIDKVLEDFGDCDIYFPDKGAQDRYQNLFPNHNILCGKKTRIL